MVSTCQEAFYFNSLSRTDVFCGFPSFLLDITDGGALLFARRLQFLATHFATAEFHPAVVSGCGNESLDFGGACLCGAIHDFSRLRSLGHGPYDSGRLAAGRAGSVPAGKAPPENSPEAHTRRSRLLCLLWLLGGSASRRSLVVHVPPRLAMVWLLDDSSGVLAGHGEVEMRPQPDQLSVPQKIFSQKNSKRNPMCRLSNRCPARRISGIWEIL